MASEAQGGGPGLLLDRDGTVIEERGYIVHAEDIVPLPGVVDALSRLRAEGWSTALITNQSAVARQLISERRLEELHRDLLRSLQVQAVFVCPHHPEAGCQCRKPRSGLALRALRELDLDPRRTVMVGDQVSDCEAARRAGIAAALVLTGKGPQFEELARAAGFPIYADVPALIDELLAGTFPGPRRIQSPS